MCSGKSQAEDMRKRRGCKKGIVPAPRRRPSARRPATGAPQDQNASSIARPARTLTRPRKRICPSLICKARSKMRRHDRGLRNGNRPSATSISATALSATSQNSTPAKGYFREGVARRRSGAPHRLEEVAARVEDHQVRLVAEARPVGLEAAIELRELRIAPERLGEDRRCLGVAVALDLLRIAIGLGDDHLALAIGVGADLLALGGAGGAQLVGDLLALRRHPAVDRLGDVADEVDPLDAHVEDLDAERLGVVGEAAADVLHHLVARAREHLADGALGHLLVERCVHDRRQARLEVPHVGAVVADELARVGDAPLHQPVDHQALLLGGEDRPRLGTVERLDAAVEEGDVLERRRQLPLESRLLDHFLDLAELVDHRDLALVDDEEGR